ncbi:protein of unknown function [Taphrina deformans PYCC 5710]|uniref:Uncharacterized protein n=1 Tax=Taphrina deformans (strain PYCC 5710 / ATCC 11124 / CBS 356.35 / IMI 108563 / JCM 9778 / NBRC 8474) TaxID=1097556 RepID=R4X6U0_TAPDE|nr:protein of unknown function [Taphrina deformans PYCC 5710]|eukprot:CCG80661.1 protein of unknown function [Taphrina deformans PYCC 5710]
MSQYKRHIEPVGGVGSLVQSNGKHLPPRFSDYAIPNRADHASDTNQLLSIVRTRAVRTTQDELENLRVLCQKLEHQLQQQLTQISSLEKVEKKTAELGAQWNFFHHAQMQKQAIMYREHYEKREAELKAHQADLQNRLTLVSRENALLKGKVGLCGNVTQVSSTVKQSITSSHPVHSPRAMHGHTAAPSKLKRKKCLDDRDASHTTRIQPVNVTSDVAGEKMDESRRAVQTSSRIPTRTSSAPELLESSDESRESPCKKPRLSSLPNSSTMNVPVPLAAPLQLVDGILPPPVKIVLDNQERYIDPKIAEIKQDLATGTAEQKTMIPPIVTGS